MQSKPKRQLGSRTNDYLSTIRNPVSADPACYRRLIQQPLNLDLVATGASHQQSIPF